MTYVSNLNLTLYHSGACARILMLNGHKHETACCSFQIKACQSIMKLNNQ